MTDRTSMMRRLVVAMVLAGAAWQVSSAQTRSTAKPASGPLPEVLVGGIQIAKVTLTDDDMLARPFNTENGTKLVLWVKMPKGQGLIEVDDDASLLERFADDKGTDLGGSLDNFPDEFKDGSGATLEITSSAIPAATATRLLAEGKLSMAIATGSKPQRVANVHLENDRSFALGQTKVVVAEVSAEGEEQRFTFKLPRQVMLRIRDVKFFGAKNQPIEASSAGGGYFNDEGEMGYRVKTTQKTLTVEFDMWQGQRTIEVPFKVSAGLGLQP